MSRRNRKRRPRQARPLLLDAAGVRARLRPLFTAGTHWFLLRPVGVLDSVFVLGRLGPHLGAGDFLGMVPLAGRLLVLVVLATRKDRTKAGEVLAGLGFDAGEAARLEEEMAAGKDVLCLCEDPDLAGEVLSVLQSILGEEARVCNEGRATCPPRVNASAGRRRHP
jgi:hypothetical protein